MDKHIPLNPQIYIINSKIYIKESQITNKLQNKYKESFKILEIFDDLITALQDIWQNLVKNNLLSPVNYALITEYLEIIDFDTFITQWDLVFFLRIPLVLYCDSLKDIPIQDLRAFKQLTTQKLYLGLSAYPIV